MKKDRILSKYFALFSIKDKSIENLKYLEILPWRFLWYVLFLIFKYPRWEKNSIFEQNVMLSLKNKSLVRLQLFFLNIKWNAYDPVVLLNGNFIYSVQDVPDLHFASYLNIYKFKSIIKIPRILRWNTLLYYQISRHV